VTVLDGYERRFEPYSGGSSGQAGIKWLGPKSFVRDRHNWLRARDVRDAI